MTQKTCTVVINSTSKYWPRSN